MKNTAIILVAVLAVVSLPGYAQSSSYLDSVYQTYQLAEGENNKESTVQRDPTEILKDQIYEKYGIFMVDEPLTNPWPMNFLEAAQQVLAAVPEDFRSCCKIITLDPSFMQYDLKFNGYDERHGEVQLGYGAIVPSTIYSRSFNKTHGRLPNDSEIVARFKSVLARGMAYAWMMEYPEVADEWRKIYHPNEISTLTHSQGTDQYMIVAPGVNHILIDMAFSVAMYCSNASSLNSISSTRHDFIKDKVMSGQSLSGWNAPVVTPTDPDNSDNGGNTDPIEQPGDQNPPEIPDGDYIPIYTEVDVGTSAATIPSDQHTGPDKMKNAIVDLFGELPKFFSTCTQAITYFPTTDTEMAFSSEGFVFITQHSWHMPSFTDLDTAARSKRFKMILLNEMALRFLYFHPEVTKKWQKTFGEDMSDAEAYRGIRQAVVAYWGNSSWLNQLDPQRYQFVRKNIMNDIEY